MPPSNFDIHDELLNTPNMSRYTYPHPARIAKTWKASPRARSITSTTSSTWRRDTKRYTALRPSSDMWKGTLFWGDCTKLQIPAMEPSRLRWVRSRIRKSCGRSIRTGRSSTMETISTSTMNYSSITSTPTATWISQKTTRTPTWINTRNCTLCPRGMKGGNTSRIVPPSKNPKKEESPSSTRTRVSAYGNSSSTVPSSSTKPGEDKVPRYRILQAYSQRRLHLQLPQRRTILLERDPKPKTEILVLLGAHSQWSQLTRPWEMQRFFSTQHRHRQIPHLQWLQSDDHPQKRNWRRRLRAQRPR